MKKLWSLAVSGAMLAIALGTHGHAEGATPPPGATGFNHAAVPPTWGQRARHDGCAIVPAAVIRSADGSQRWFPASSACGTVAVMPAAMLPGHTDYVGTGMLPTIDCTSMEVAALHTDTTVADGGQQAVYMVRSAPPEGATLRNGDVLQILPQATMHQAPVTGDVGPATTMQIARIQPSNQPAHAIAVARVPSTEISPATSISIDADSVHRVPMRLTQSSPDGSVRVIRLCSTPLSRAYDAAVSAPSTPTQRAPAEPAPE